MGSCKNAFEKPVGRSLGISVSRLMNVDFIAFNNASSETSTARNGVEVVEIFHAAIDDAKGDDRLEFFGDDSFW